MTVCMSQTEHPPSPGNTIPSHKYIVLWMIVSLTKAQWTQPPCALWKKEEKREG